MILYAIVFLIAWNAVCWLVLGRLFAPVLPGGWWTVLGLAVFCILPFPLFVDGVAGGGYPSALTRILVFRPFWYTQLSLPLLTGAGLIGAFTGLLFGYPGTGGRLAVKAVGVLLMTLVVAGYLGSRRLAVRELEFSFPNLPASFDGLRVAQLSDLHVGPQTSKRHLTRILEEVRAASPDLVALTGDQVDDYAGDLVPFKAAFQELSAPEGVFVITGNHDVYAGWNEVRAGMEDMGFTVLVNEAIPLRRGDEEIWIAGTGDPAGRSRPARGGEDAAPDLDHTVAEIPEDAFSLVLAHNPSLWPGLAGRGVELTISGHTHYGQFSIPALHWNLAGMFLPYSMETYRQPDGAALYINPGTNFWGIPLRIGHPAEVTVITLRRGPVNDGR
ncbi:MAG: metallophosphoesterase [Gemmatimonadota bacterium]|jgi:predicted MPP superfamily phosphohydrolase|nr:metallophosphoesterase [Gemmatimonadota bacterium]